jgi:hypothetical protein
MANDMSAFLAAVTFWIAAFPASSNLHQDKPLPKQAAALELFEDDADGLLKLLTNPGDGAGQGQAEAKSVFSGTQSLKVTSYQRFHRTLPGWNHAIREKPKAGEYRYLRFAWKSEGANCLMLQLHDATDWHIRYTAGPNPYGWQTKFVADKAPATWTLVTIDLFKDFGDRTLTGIAFTIHGGAGYFDHVYLGRTIDDLDRIDANGLAAKKLVLDKQDLDRLWQELVAEDAAIQYRAFWTLVSGRDRSVPFLKEKLSPAKVTENKQLREWIRNLDSSNFTLRAAATAGLKKQLESALPLLEAELARNPSAELRSRLQALIAELPARDRERLRRALTQRILEYAATTQ